MLPKLMRSCRVSLLLVAWMACGISPAQDAGQDGWKTVQVPEIWKRPPAGRGGYSWYRCLVSVPDDWRGQSLTLFSEPVDDARGIFVNGHEVGRAGSFPPRFRSGLGSRDRHPVDAKIVNFGKTNVIAFRIYNSDGRSGFNVAAPVLFGAKSAIRLAGSWQLHEGDDRSWATIPADVAARLEPFAKIQPTADVERILRQLPGEDGMLSVAESLKRFQLPDDLQVEAVLSEPEIGQPLFLDFDSRGRMWVLNYKQYPSPAGLTTVSRDKYLRTVYDQVPLPPPNHFRGKDKITIHEDTDGDGVYDLHKTFVDGLSLATSFARGRGGLFVLNPPYLLFYPDEDQDDVPDGDPHVLLQGFGMEDSHSIASNIRWGPDGWLYASQGSTVTGHIKRYGSKDTPVHSMGQLIWRYHPETKQYEIFAEGGGNTFGVEIDAKGRVYSGHNGGDTRGFHYVQGGYYRKGFGKHGELSNPFAFGYFPNIAHHKVARFTHKFIIYEGAALSAQYAGKLFGVGPLQSHVIYSDFQPKGATFQTKDLGTALTSGDPWFRPVAIEVGPDGAIYVCDFHEQRIDHASHYQGRVTPDTGRIYRISARDGGGPGEAFDYRKLSNSKLVTLLRHENKWHRQIALRVIADRRDPALVEPLTELLEDANGQNALEAFWALNLVGAFDEQRALTTLRHDDPFVRAWSVRLLCDDGKISAPIAGELARMAKLESNVEVRCQLACSARRLPTAQSLLIVGNLLRRDEDNNDPFVPLLLWWAIEAKAESGRADVVRLLGNKELWSAPLVQQHILERLMRRYALAGERANLTTCARMFELAPDAESSKRLLKGFEAAFAGRTLADIPDELADALANVGGGSLELRLRRRDPMAAKEALALVADEMKPAEQRQRYIRILGQIGQADCVPVLLRLAATSKSDQVRIASLTALQAYNQPTVASKVIAMHNGLPQEVRPAAQTLLASRQAWSLDLLNAVEAHSISADAVSTPIVQKLLFHNNPAINQRVGRIWTTISGSSTDEMRAEVARLQQVIGSAAGNPYHGKQLFLKNCGKCHILFTDGGQIGPNLTSYKRDDLRSMLLNIVNPSLEIREGFQNFVVFNADGRTLNGFVSDQDNRVVVLKGADGQHVIIPRDDIDEMRAIPQSIMPERLLSELEDQQVRDLFAYLRATQPLP
jgi:putative heme-binding domain-containing protein